MRPHVAVLPLALALAALSGACDDLIVPEPPEPTDDATDAPVDPRLGDVLALTGDSAAGEALFDAEGCGGCHDKAGAEDRVGPAMATAVPAASDETLVDVLINGSGIMPPYGSLTDQEVADLLAWMRATFP